MQAPGGESDERPVSDLGLGGVADSRARRRPVSHVTTLCSVEITPLLTYIVV